MRGGGLRGTPPPYPYCVRPTGQRGGTGVQGERGRGARGGQEEGGGGVSTLRPAGPVLVRLCGSPLPPPQRHQPLPKLVLGDAVTAAVQVMESRRTPLSPRLGAARRAPSSASFGGHEAAGSEERGGGAGLLAVPAAFIVRSPAPLRQLRARCHHPGHNGGGGGSPLPGTKKGTKGGHEGDGAPRATSFGMTPGRALCGSPALSRDPRRGEPGMWHERGQRWGRFSQVTARLLLEPQAALGAAMGPIQPHAANAALRVLISAAQHRGHGAMPTQPGGPLLLPILWGAAAGGGGMHCSWAEAADAALLEITLLHARRQREKLLSRALSAQPVRPHCQHSAGSGGAAPCPSLADPSPQQCRDPPASIGQSVGAPQLQHAPGSPDEGVPKVGGGLHLGVFCGMGCAYGPTVMHQCR